MDTTCRKKFYWLLNLSVVSSNSHGLFSVWAEDKVLYLRTQPWLVPCFGGGQGQDYDITFIPGTNVTKAKQLLVESGLPITPADDLEDVAIKAVSSINNKG